jgi:flagellar hook-associated protein 1 FlgK
MGSLQRGMEQLRNEVNGRLAQSVRDVNDLAAEIAGINRELSSLPAGRGGSGNDLLDRRERVLGELAGLVGVRTVAQDGTGMNVFLETGEALVVGAQAFSLSTAASPLDPSTRQIVYRGSNGMESVVGGLRGGTVGGLLRFRQEVLDPAQNALGRLAITVADRFNAQHQVGMDLLGAQGQALFSVAAPEAMAHPGNAGGAAVQLTVVDSGALRTSDYELRYDGASYSLLRLSDGVRTSLSGAGPFAVDGLEIQVDSSGGAAAAGDRFLLRPTRNAAGSFQLLLSDPRELAVASAVRTAAGPGNQGSGAISAGQVIDPGNANLLRSLELRFADPPTSYDVVDVASTTVIASAQPYGAGSDIEVNGLRLQISGAPAAGDSFRVEANSGAVGDNRNALAMAALMEQPWLEGGTASLRDGADGLAAQVGASTRGAQLGLEAQQALQTHLSDLRDSVSGVNLEEEAANLLRFQQAYQAAAQLIRVSGELFQSLLAAVGR